MAKNTSRAVDQAGKRTDKPAVNHAAMHRDELVAAIESATVAQLHAIDADLAREGWDADGQTRKRITQRLAERHSDGTGASSKSTRE